MKAILNSGLFTAMTSRYGLVLVVLAAVLLAASGAASWTR
jgi:hypothetical protein